MVRYQAPRWDLRYMTLPIVGPDAVTAENAARLAHAIQHARTDGDVLVHCASGNRVGALIALERGLVHRDTPAQAIALGRAAGLTTLEPCVVQLLNP
ncbi:hypothetical protein [Xanthomonas campestris]|uniref:hypothetical protein n=1 Tax=Xanthomonas campestris TaxID=339 RepID=UPI003CF43EB5